MPLPHTSWLTRLLRGGVSPSHGERRLLEALVAHLPEHLREVVDAQLGECNLVQREVDGRALNFYRVSGWPGRPQPPSRMLGSTKEATLVRLTMDTEGFGQWHATLSAVGGRVFCMAVSRPVPPGCSTGGRRAAGATSTP